MSKKTEIKEFTYAGKLSEVIIKYIAEKRAMGILFNSEAKKLAHFDRFTMNFDCKTNTLSKELVIAYTSKTSNESSSNHIYRFNLVNRLALYMQRCGYEAYYQPKGNIKKSHTEYTPYIYSYYEIKKIFIAADETKASPQHKNYHWVVPLMFRILYTCGLRVSEMLNLTVKDVDLKRGVLNIQGTKFDKGRLVPLSNSVLQRCIEYSKQLHQLSKDDAIYFPSAKNKAFSMTRMYYIFREILQKAGISHGGKGKGPRIHDFRHTFAVHCLKQWVEKGVDITVSLPYLSAFLGHTGLQSSQKYLRLTSDLFPSINVMLENCYGDIIPLVGGDIDENN
ncbi:tyrosine-type recombinase/integrase [Clostridium sp. PL3]|uniref:Tyrosine-type recombinase/integrase n=1 Tax=Clostridium thailandense TaxID=2794346 RepID=A0A949TZX2_9CLOT|nr:tyrosine-type recombinase/integrase [Clostridium thailandense]MBV7273913.1 tyrosine-type recombinase/integrase [Clostridium thailandense]